MSNETASQQVSADRYLHSNLDNDSNYFRHMLQWKELIMVQVSKVPTWLKLLTEARKLGVFLVTIGAFALAQGLIPAPWDRWVSIVITVLGAVGVYGVENKKKEPAAVAA